MKSIINCHVIYFKRYLKRVCADIMSISLVARGRRWRSISLEYKAEGLRGCNNWFVFVFPLFC